MELPVYSDRLSTCGGFSNKGVPVGPRHARSPALKESIRNGTPIGMPESSVAARAASCPAALHAGGLQTKFADSHPAYAEEAVLEMIPRSPTSRSYPLEVFCGEANIDRGVNKSPHHCDCART